jgi:hypothetical protein
MDGTSGGTMTPPRDEDATCEHFAAVIPLRRRQHDVELPLATVTLEPDSCNLWDPDAPPASLTARRLPHDRPNGGQTDAPTTTARVVDRSGEDASAQASPRPGVVRTVRRRGWIAAACSGFAMAALAIALTGGGHPATTRSATVAPGVTIRPSVKHSHTATQTKPRSHRVPVRRDARAEPLTKRASKAPVRLARVTASTHTPLLGTAVSESATTSTAGTLLQAPPTPQSARTASGLEASRRSTASPCVPGELGC